MIYQNSFLKFDCNQKSPSCFLLFSVEGVYPYNSGCAPEPATEPNPHSSEVGWVLLGASLEPPVAVWGHFPAEDIFGALGLLWEASLKASGRRSEGTWQGPKVAYVSIFALPAESNEAARSNRECTVIRT